MSKTGNEIFRAALYEISQPPRANRANPGVLSYVKTDCGERGAQAIPAQFARVKVCDIKARRGETPHCRMIVVANLFLPSSIGFQWIVRIINIRQTKPLTVYVDNLEALFMSADKIEAAVSEITGEAQAPEATPTLVLPSAATIPTFSPVPPTPTYAPITTPR